MFHHHLQKLILYGIHQIQPQGHHFPLVGLANVHQTPTSAYTLDVQALHGGAVMVGLVLTHDLTRQSVELHQWPLDLRKEVSEDCNSPSVSGVNLVLGTESREPDLS